MIWRLVVSLALIFALSSAALSQEEEGEAPLEAPSAEEAAPEAVEEPAAPPVEAEPAAPPVEAEPPPPPPPAPAGPPPPGAVLLSDTFDDPTVGMLPRSSSDPRFARGYVGGEYQLQKLDPQTATGPFANLPGTFGNASLAIDARLVGDTVGRDIRLYCRIQPGPGLRGYRLILFPQAGELRLDRLDDGPSAPLVPSQRSGAIRRGNDVNRIELSCAGTVISVRVNGVLVDWATDPTYGEGVMRIAAATREGVPLVEARFDNLVVTQQADEAPPSPGPYDGAWSGSSPDGRTISFTVRHDAITSFGVQYNLSGNNCGVAGSHTLRPPDAVRIANQSFSATIVDEATFRWDIPGFAPVTTGTITYTINGRFTAPNSVSGTTEVAIFAVGPRDGDPPCQGTARTTWTATKSG